MALALERSGWRVLPALTRADDASGAAAGVDLLLITTPDHAVAEVARSVEPVPTTVVAHLSGALGLDALAPHPRRASVHPLVSLPDPERGAAALRRGAWFAVEGDAIASDVVAALGGCVLRVPADQRAAYHAAACIAANHVVALMAQVERVGALAGVPLGAYLDLAREALENVAVVGPAAALTGPAARGDTETIERHCRAIEEGLGPEELERYLVFSRSAEALACR